MYKKKKMLLWLILHTTHYTYINDLKGQCYAMKNHTLPHTHAHTLKHVHTHTQWPRYRPFNLTLYSSVTPTPIDLLTLSMAARVLHSWPRDLDLSLGTHVSQEWGWYTARVRRWGGVTGKWCYSVLFTSFLPAPFLNPRDQLFDGLFVF